jgi:hypothetical protein
MIFVFLSVVTPPAHLDQLSNTHEITLIIKMMKHRLIKDSKALTLIIYTAVILSELD